MSLATENQAAAGRGRGSKEAVLKWSCCSFVVLEWSLEKVQSQEETARERQELGSNGS